MPDFNWSWPSKIERDVIERALIKYFGTCLGVIRDLGAPPVAFAVSLTGICSYRIAVPRAVNVSSDQINRETLLLPVVTADASATAPDVLLKPALDLLWNAFGYEESPHFDEQGKFKA